MGFRQRITKITFFPGLNINRGKWHFWPLAASWLTNPWDCHGTGEPRFLRKQSACSPCNPGTCIMKVTLRVVSNLSFTATFDVQKTPGFPEKPGVFCILALSTAPVVARACRLDQALWPLTISVSLVDRLCRRSGWARKSVLDQLSSWCIGRSSVSDGFERQVDK